jgi:hypothetical protein
MMFGGSGRFGGGCHQGQRTGHCSRVMVSRLASSGGRRRGPLGPSHVDAGEGVGPWRSRQCQLPVGGARGCDRWRQQYQTTSTALWRKMPSSVCANNARHLRELDRTGLQLSRTASTVRTLEVGEPFRRRTNAKTEPCRQTGASASRRRHGHRRRYSAAQAVGSEI